MKRQRGGGFTLIEVLVALTVMAVMAVMAWQGVDGIVRSRDVSQGRLDETTRLNTVLAQWEQDLTAVQDSNVVPALAFDGATLRLTRRAPGGLQVVAWSLRPAGSSSQWQRWAGTAVTRSADLQEQWLRSQQLLGTEAGQLVVLTGLTQWQLYFYRGNAWSNAQSSADVAPQQQQAASGAAPRQVLPTGVRVQLTFAAIGNLTRDIALGPQQP